MISTSSIGSKRGAVAVSKEVISLVGYTEIGNSVTLSRIIGPRVTFYYSIFLFELFKNFVLGEVLTRLREGRSECGKHRDRSAGRPSLHHASEHKSPKLANFPTSYCSFQLDKPVANLVPLHSNFVKVKQYVEISGETRENGLVFREVNRSPEFPPVSRDIIFNVDGEFEALPNNLY